MKHDLIAHSSGLPPRLSCLSVRAFSNPLPVHADLGTKSAFWVEEGWVGKVVGWGRQLPVGTWGRRWWRRGRRGESELASCLPCSLLYCTAAVSAGMAPLTICSLIANIRVHFLRHWTGNERLRAVLWAFLSLSLPFLLNLQSPWLCGVRTHERAHTSLTGWPLSHLGNLYYLSVCAAVHPSYKNTQVQCRSKECCHPLHILQYPLCDYTLSQRLIIPQRCTLYFNLNCSEQMDLWNLNEQFHCGIITFTLCKMFSTGIIQVLWGINLSVDNLIDQLNEWELFFWISIYRERLFFLSRGHWRFD